eukprot:1698517-Rhodomonas_salina.1
MVLPEPMESRCGLGGAQESGSGSYLLCPCYAISGTGVAYPATPRPVLTQEAGLCQGPQSSVQRYTIVNLESGSTSPIVGRVH